MTHRRALKPAVIAALVAAISLSACTPVTLTAKDASPSPSASESVDASPSPSETPSPSPSPSDTPAALPADCTSVVSPTAYDKVFQGTPLNDPGFVDPTLVGVIAPVAPPAGATAEEIVASAVELRCVWRDPMADITGISIEYSRIDDTTAAQYTNELAAQGYTCTDTNGGRQCQLVKPNEQYPVDEGYTALARKGVVIFVRQFNFPTSGLMAQLTTVVWGG